MRVRLILLVFAVFLLVGGCSNRKEAIAQTGGDAARGRNLFHKHGCSGCHTLPGLPGADGRTGPHLGNVGSRATWMGGVPNTPQNLVDMIRDPKRMKPHTSMPDMNVSEQEARDLAALLYTAR